MGLNNRYVYKVPDLQVFKMGRFLFSILISYAGEERSVNNSDLFFFSISKWYFLDDLMDSRLQYRKNWNILRLSWQGSCLETEFFLLLSA